MISGLIINHIMGSRMNLLSKWAGVKSTLRSHIRDHFVLEWKSMLKVVESTLKIVESTLNRVIQTTLEWIPR